MGVYAKHAMETWTRAVIGNGVRVELTSYDQGYARSRARSRWVIISPKGDDTTLEFSHDIHHVPNARMELFWVQTELVSAPGNDEVLRHYFGGIAPFSSVTTARADGRVESTFVVTPGRAPLHGDPSVLFEWVDVSGRLTLDAATDTWALEQTIGAFALHEAGGGLVLFKGIRVSLEFPRMGAAPPAQALRVSVAEVASHNASQSVRANGVEMTARYDQAGNRYSGSVRVRAKSMSGEQAGRKLALLEPYYAFEVENLSQETIDSLQATPADPDEPVSSGDDRGSKLFAEVLESLSAAGTRLTLSTGASFEAGGSVGADAELAVAGRVTGQAPGQEALLGAVNGSLEVKVSATLLERYLAHLAREDAAAFLACKGMGATEADVNLMTASMVRGAVNARTKAGLLIRAGDEYRAVMRLHRGNATLNDRPLMAVLFSMPIDVPPHFAPGSGFNRIARFDFSNAKGSLRVILEGTACAEILADAIQVTIIDGRARLNPKVEPLKGTDLFSLRAALGRWKGAPGKSNWAIAQRSDALELRRQLSTLEDEVPLDGLRFKIQALDAITLGKRWIIFEGHDGNKSYWYSQGPKDIFAEKSFW